MYHDLTQLVHFVDSFYILILLWGSWFELYVKSESAICIWPLPDRHRQQKMQQQAE